MRVLNLYAGIGGNRKLWEGVQVTAVELDPNIADVYRSLYSQDTVIVGDAHEYLLNHYMDFDFIWSSTPCQSHGQYRYNVGVLGKGFKALYPDMKLYEEILLLKYYFKGLWVVENTKPFYTPLVEPTSVLQRHLFWSNFPIANKDFKAKDIRSKNKLSDYSDLGFDLTHSKIPNKRQVLRNCVDSELGLHILNCAIELCVAPKNARAENEQTVDAV